MISLFQPNPGTRLRIEGWTVGCWFVPNPGTGTGARLLVEDVPLDGTSSSRVSGVWYGNAEIKDYVNRQRAWHPYSGLFRIVPGIGLLPGQGPEGQVEFGWYRKRLNDE